MYKLYEPYIEASKERNKTEKQIQPQEKTVKIGRSWDLTASINAQCAT
jgi:hypothetical protein